jgi:hypothetical protein
MPPSFNQSNNMPVMPGIPKTPGIPGKPKAPKAPDIPANFPKFTLYLITTTGEFIMAQGASVNGLAAQAKFWLEMGTEGPQIQDNQIKGVRLDQRDPKTGASVRTTSQQAISRAMVMAQIHRLGAR